MSIGREFCNLVKLFPSPDNLSMDSRDIEKELLYLCS